MNPALRFLNTSLINGACLVLVFSALFSVLGTSAKAQTLVEVQLVAAITSELSNLGMMSWPTGSYRALGAGADRLIASIPDANLFSNWEVYTATGIAARLQPAFVQQVTTSFAVAGFFLEEQSEQQVGQQTHTRYLFSDGVSAQTMLYVISSPAELIWLVASGQ